jgi:hypothetical protein
MLRFNITPSTPTHIFQRFTDFLIPSEKRSSVASLTNFAPRQILDRIVIADEFWVHHYEQESKAQSMARKRLTSPVAKKFKSQSTGKS